MSDYEGTLYAAFVKVMSGDGDTSIDDVRDVAYVLGITAAEFMMPSEEALETIKRRRLFGITTASNN